MFYNLGEVKFAKGETDEAAKWYQKAADLDPTWGKPIFKLGLVQLNKGDKDGADRRCSRRSSPPIRRRRKRRRPKPSSNS